jgi:hypothetical protein
VRKEADVTALHRNPAQHAGVFCVDEKSAIQALGRKDRRLPHRQDAPSATVSSTTAMALCPCLPR